MDKSILSLALRFQRNEITEHYVYSNISKRIKDEKNKKIVEHISKDELKHYHLWRDVTKRDVKPNMIKIYLYSLLSIIFGLTFSLKFMERGEKDSIKNYREISRILPKFTAVMADEHKHEKNLIGLISEERVEYASSLVLGLNDALVELTGALTGFTLALQNSKIVALTGLITGISASMSMAASGYLSSREDKSKNPRKSALYTGTAYIITVMLLILPYLIFKNVYLSLAVMIGTAILVIFSYTFYISTAKNLSFWRRFIEMSLISLSIAAISFGFGLLMKMLFNVQV